MFDPARHKRGFTLTELLVAIVVFALIASVIAAVSVSAARSARLSKLESRYLAVSDTVGAALRDILSGAEFIEQRGECAVFISEKYSPCEASLRSENGVAELLVYSGGEPEIFTPLSKESYGGFSLDDLKVSPTDGGFYCSFTLSYGDYSESTEFSVFSALGPS